MTADNDTASAEEPYDEEDWYRAEVEYDDDVVGDDTVPELVDRRTAEHDDGVAQMYKGGVYDRTLVDAGAVEEAPDGDFTSLSYDEMRDVYRRLAFGFDELGVERGDRVGIFSDTRLEWALSDFALLSRGAVVTTVYASSSPPQARYLLDNPDASGVVVENQEILERVLEVEEELSLEFIVVIDQIDDEHLGRDDVDVHTLGDVYETGVEKHDNETFDGWLDGTASDDLCTLIYTSGTTGPPKGVEIRHENFRSCLNQMWKRVGPRPDKPEGMPVVDEEMRVLSFLPLAHAFERFVHLALVTAGATVAYAESTEPEALREDMRLVKPKGIATVPRLLEKIYGSAVEEVSDSPVKRRVFDWAVGVGQDVWRFYESCEEPTGVARATRDPPPFLRAKYRLADALVYSRIRDALGGEVGAFLSAGGSLSEELARTYQGIDLPVYEGYGMTETSPVISISPPEDPKVGKLGPPLCDMEVKVDETHVGDEVLEGRDGDVGELLVRGPNVVEGYWKMPEKTDEAFEEAEDGDDWFRTGDVVEICPDGYLRFVDRVKNLVVLSTGKNVPAERVEEAVEETEFVEQCMVVGDGRKFVGALVVPDFESVRSWADEEGVELPDEDDALAEDGRVHGLVEDAVEEANSGFEEHERVKRLEVVAEEWTQEDDLMTPTMKKKRHRIKEVHADEIESVYEDG